MWRRPAYAMTDDNAMLAKITGPGTRSRLINAKRGTTTNPAPRPVDACRTAPVVMASVDAATFAIEGSIGSRSSRGIADQNTDAREPVSRAMTIGAVKG